MSIKLVSKQPEEAIAAQRALQAEERARSTVSYRLRDLTANLIRIARGAGKPYEIEEQAARLLEACDEYRATVGHGVPTDQVHAMLRVRHDLPDDHDWTDGQHARNAGEERMISGALQVAASRLLGQRTQEMRGSSEMHDGLRIIERQREENRRRWKAPTTGNGKGRGKGKASEGPS